MKKLIFLLAFLPFLASGQITNTGVKSQIDSRLSTQIRPVDIRFITKLLADYIKQGDSTGTASYVDLTSAQTIQGNKSFGGYLTAGSGLTTGSNIIPASTNTAQVGTTSNKFTSIVANNFLGSAAAVYFGNATTAQPVYFRQGGATSLLGGFHASGNFFTQSRGDLIADNGSAFQIHNNVSPTAALGRGMHLNPNFVASANNDTFSALDVTPTTNVGAFTGVSTFAQRWYNPNGTVASSLSSNGLQEWYIGTTPIGSIRYQNAGGYPGIAFYSPGGSGRSQVRQLSSTGGLAFAASTGNNNPASQLVLFTSGNLSLGSNSETDTGQRLQVGGSSYFDGNLTVTADILPSANDSKFIGSATNNFSEVHSRNFVSNGGMVFKNGTLGVGWQEVNSTSRYAGFYPTTHNFYLQAVGSPSTDTGQKLQVGGSSYLGGLVTVQGDVNPDTDGTRDMGNASVRWRVIYANTVVTPGTARYGTTSTGQPIWITQGSSSNITLGAFASGNWYVQDRGVAGTDTGEKLQVSGKVKATDDIEITTLGKGVIIKSDNGTRWRLRPSNAGASLWEALP